MLRFVLINAKIIKKGRFVSYHLYTGHCQFQDQVKSAYKHLHMLFIIFVFIITRKWETVRCCTFESARLTDRAIHHHANYGWALFFSTCYTRILFNTIFLCCRCLLITVFKIFSCNIHIASVSIWHYIIVLMFL